VFQNCHESFPYLVKNALAFQAFWNNPIRIAGFKNQERIRDLMLLLQRSMFQRQDATHQE
jgi:hypothetical protein